LPESKEDLSNILEEVLKMGSQFKFRLPNYSFLESKQDVFNLINEMFKLRQKRGSFGGYTISTLLTLLAFKDF